MLKIEVENTKLGKIDLLQYVKNNVLVGPKKHFVKMYELLPSAAKFAFMLLEVIVCIFLSPIYGILIISLYLWGEMNLSEMLTTRQIIVFWFVSLPLAIFQLLIAVKYILPYIQ